jgi:hypothetical protein
MDQHPTQVASPPSCSIYRRSPLLLIFLYFSNLQIRLVDFKKKHKIIHYKFKIPLIGNPHRQHTSSNVTASSPIDRWNVDVFGCHLLTSTVRSDLSNWQSPMIAIWYRPSCYRYRSICALYGIFGQCAFKRRMLWGYKNYFVTYDMIKLIIKYIFFPYYMINNTYIGSGPLLSMFILGHDK